MTPLSHRPGVNSAVGIGGALQRGPRWKSMQCSDSVLCWHQWATGAQILFHSMTPRGSSFITATATLCRIPSAVGLQLQSFLLWQHAIKCELIHNVLCSLSKLPVSSLITGWAVVMMLSFTCLTRREGGKTYHIFQGQGKEEVKLCQRF